MMNLVSRINTTSIDDCSGCFTVTKQDRAYPFDMGLKTLPEYQGNPAFFGPGIYTLFDKLSNCLVYLGLWTPSQSVVDGRLRKHLQTLTLRGGDVQFNKKSHVTLASWFEDFDTRRPGRLPYSVESQALRDALMNCTDMTAGENRLYKGGVVATGGKPRYADSCWDDFGIWSTADEMSAGIAKRFYFQLDRIEGYFDNGLSGKALRSELQHGFETNLIMDLNPLVNKQYDCRRPVLPFVSNDGVSGPETVTATIRSLL